MASANRAAAVSSIVKALIGASLVFALPGQAQDSSAASKKCVEFGFQPNTSQHAECVRQWLLASGAAKAPNKPTPSASRPPPPAPLPTNADSGPMPAVIKDCADCPEMVVIPAGSFEMGSYENSWEQPVHRVNVPSFLIGKTEVTQGQWKAVLGRNPSYFRSCGDDCPVERVSWNDAQDFARRLSQKAGKQYRLPSAAEWEYAARAGSNTKWSFGDNESQLGEYAWFASNSQHSIQPVAQKRPNAFGLFDMHGNVWEWVQDCWHDNYSGAPTDGSAWTKGDCSYRVIRGGAFNGKPTDLRSADLYSHAPHIRYFYSSGFRLARTLLSP